MSNIVTRLLLVFIAVPALVLVTLFVPEFGHWPLVLVVLAFAAGSSVELGRMFDPEAGKARLAYWSLLGLAAPLCAYAAGLTGGKPLVAAAIGAMIAMILAAAPIALEGDGTRMAFALRDASRNALMVFYVGFASSFLVAIAASGELSGRRILWFMFVSFANDSFAWLFGNLFGKHRALVRSSPNKSAEGFAGGLAGSIAFAFAGPAVFPGLTEGTMLSSPISLALLGLAMWFAGTTGDLFESALKRSARVKDSGVSVPGRGGFLDSFDSILFGAPVFYLFIALGTLAGR